MGGHRALRVGSPVCRGAAVGDSLAAAGGAGRAEYGIVEDYVGHGIGTSMHMTRRCRTTRLRQGPDRARGLTIAIEPMVTLGAQDNHVLADEWTVSTDDGSRAAH